MDWEGATRERSSSSDSRRFETNEFAVGNVMEVTLYIIISSTWLGLGIG